MANELYESYPAVSCHVNRSVRRGTATTRTITGRTLQVLSWVEEWLSAIADPFFLKVQSPMEEHRVRYPLRSPPYGMIYMHAMHA